MIPDNTLKNDDHSTPPSTPAVTSCGLELTEVRLFSLICIPGTISEDIPTTANLKREGDLVPGSLTATGFRASVSWSVEFPTDTTPPIKISGKHTLTFTVKKPISETAAKYYAEINSVILVYPYLRQLIDDLSVKSLGRNIMIRPLDVPKFVQTHSVVKHLPPESEDQRMEAGSDGQEVTG